MKEITKYIEENKVNNGRLNVLLIAYACEPGRGSEPGTGWNMAMGLATRHDLTVATRANNRARIEDELQKVAPANPPRFLYIDPPQWTLRLKARGLMPIQIFYYLWQRELATWLRKANDNFDIIHQLTFNSFEVPPLDFFHLKGAKVWGPIGGGQTVPSEMLRAFGPGGSRSETLRNGRVRLSAKSPWVRRTLANADLVLFANNETHGLLAPECKGKCEMMIDVGVDLRKFKPERKAKRSDQVTFLAAGRLEARKGIILLLESFAAFAKGHQGSDLRIVGDGPEMARIKQAIAALGLSGRVILSGAVSHDAMQREFESADVFVFPSLRDTSGAVVLEAMAMELPVICFDHQGTALMVPLDCGIRIPISSFDKTVALFRAALTRMAGDTELRRLYGSRGRQVVASNYDWSVKVARIDKFYREIS